MAPAMLESMRAIGYSFDAALADVIDNSVAASAERVAIQVRRQPFLYVAIIDDGTGMSPEGLREAMRLGGAGPGAARAETDLGRFGLGLKTASLSQCRRLTVVTLRDGELSGAIWDLDRIAASNDWTLTLLEADEVRSLPHADEIVEAGHGTIVLWQDFDRAAAGEASEGAVIERLVDDSRSMLALAFHRYIGGGTPDGAPRRVHISLNNLPLELIDPYLSHKRSRQELPPQELVVEGGRVRIKPYILPHISRMTANDIKLAGGEEGLRREQGFYVYRNFRLIRHGTWFRMMPQRELMKLARVRVDIPNSLDHLWSLDVKKSEAYPPEAVRIALRTFIDQIGQRSARVFTHRGRTKQSRDLVYLWERTETRGGIDYLVNRKHPSVVSVATSVNVEALLRALELALPADAIYADMASDRAIENDRLPERELEAELEKMAVRLTETVAEVPGARDRLLESLRTFEPFAAHPEVTERIRKRLISVN
jgi:Histidine kinase-, DNA gyrase B-, and HSP90-like ATPase